MDAIDDPTHAETMGFSTRVSVEITCTGFLRSASGIARIAAQMNWRVAVESLPPRVAYDPRHVISEIKLANLVVKRRNGRLEAELVKTGYTLTRGRPAGHRTFKPELGLLGFAGLLIAFHGESLCQFLSTHVSQFNALLLLIEG